MKNKPHILWIARTAVFISLLIVLQAVTAMFGNTLITGTIVNLILIVSVMTAGLSTGLSVAAISPFMAKFLGIGPFWSLIPFIALGNMALVFLWHYIGNSKTERRYIAYVVALIAAAAVKFIVLYIGIVHIAIPVLLDLPEPQAAVISGIFSFNQLITASAGGVFAIAIVPTVQKAIGSRLKR
jgi:hypothetical protein